MKYVFLACFGLLLLASYVTYRSLPDAHADAPVIYWVTDANPARREQVRLFHEWLIENGRVRHVTLDTPRDGAGFVARARANPSFADAIRAANPAGEALFAGRLTDRDFPLRVILPAAELKLNMANSDRTKKIIQGVSGVAGDVIDQTSGGDMRYFRAIGLNRDVTDAARRLGFDPSHTYAALAPEITLADATGATRQYQFPCNVSSVLLYVNRGTFRQHGQELPPARWTVEEFARRGRAFVAAANRGRPRPVVFFADQVSTEVLRSSFGGSRFNETGTACTLDQPPNLRAWQTLYDWTHTDRLLPTAADIASVTVDAGYAGARPQLFNSDDPARGQYAMLWGGRHLLIQFRKYDAARAARGKPPLDMAVVEPPHGGWPNTTISTRAAMVYAGSKHPDLAEAFLAFLASEKYNMQIVRDGDSLPPNPRFTQIDAFSRPPDHPNEWDVHDGFAAAANALAVGTAYSPFVLHATADRYEQQERDRFMNRLKSRDAAARDATAAIDAEIAMSVRADPRLRSLYDKLRKQQEHIDALKPRLAGLSARGEPIPVDAKIPLALIENPYYRAYYQSNGWTR